MADLCGLYLRYNVTPVPWVLRRAPCAPWLGYRLSERKCLCTVTNISKVLRVSLGKLHFTKLNQKLSSGLCTEPLVLLRSRPGVWARTGISLDPCTKRVVTLLRVVWLLPARLPASAGGCGGGGGAGAAGPAAPAATPDLDLSIDRRLERVEGGD